MRALFCFSAAAAAAPKPQLKDLRCSYCLLLLLLLLLLFPAVRPNPDEMEIESEIGKLVPHGEAEAEFPPDHSEEARQGPPLPSSSPEASEPFTVSFFGRQRNFVYGEQFDQYVDELNSKWLSFREQGLATATVRTEMSDVTGFAACAELNLELADTWVDEDTGKLGYRWMLWPGDPVGSDVHLRNSVALLENRIASLSRALEEAHYSVPPEFSRCSIKNITDLPNSANADQASFSFAVTEDSSQVLGRLSYDSVVIKDNKLVSYPEFDLDSENNLCSLMLLRALLNHSNLLGLTEVRIRVESGDIPLLKAACSTGFRPVEMAMHKGKAHHIFVANPRLPEPAAAFLKERLFYLDRLVRELSASYFQIRALGYIHEGDSEYPHYQISSESGVAGVPVHPKEAGAKDSASLEMSRNTKVSLILSGFGAMALLLIAVLVWDKRKKYKASDRAGRSSPPLSANREEEWFLSTPPHWARTEEELDVYWGSSSEKSEDWRAGMFDR